MQKQKLTTAEHKVITLDSTYRRVLEAVEHVYAAFAHYHAPHKFDAFPLKDTDAIGAKILGRPLRDLSADDLGSYAGSAVTTVGTDLDYRHFLPRILELSIQPSVHQGLELAVIGGRLAFCGWRAWPVKEVAAVEAMFVSGFAFTLTGDPAWRNAGDALAGIARAGIAIGPALHLWQAAETKAAWFQLADFVQHRSKRLARDGLVSGPYWSDVPTETVTEVSRWLLDPAIAASLMTMAIDGEWEDDAERESLAIAADLLDAARATAPQ